MTTGTAGPLPSPIVISACCDDAVRALSQQSWMTDAQRHTHAKGVLTLILSFLPQNVMQLMLASQAVLFNAMAADASNDALRGMVDTLKLRAQSNAIASGRLSAKHMDTLIRLQGPPVALEEAAPAAATAPPPDPDPQPDISPPLPSREPDEDSSWLDEPYVEWRVETPAELAAREANARDVSEISPVSQPPDDPPMRRNAAPMPNPDPADAPESSPVLFPMDYPPTPHHAAEPPNPQPILFPPDHSPAQAISPWREAGE
ncbi:MAG: hypothetical protein EXR07_10345 [Acetobacteraceae bacterium]|nr:hypothetical protein [Acetobacteraceae bacterium]